MTRPDFPFCLCWANENWTRGWLGAEQEILISRIYDPADDLDHCHWLAKTSADPRYLRMKGRAIFRIYRPGHLPEPRRLTDMLRDVCIKTGDEDPYLISGPMRIIQAGTSGVTGSTPHSYSSPSLMPFRQRFTMSSAGEESYETCALG